MFDETTSTDPRSQLTWELLSFLENARASAEAASRAVDLARQAGREDLVKLLEAWQAATGEQATALRETLSANRLGEDQRRDVVEEASWESFPASDPPAY